MNNIIKILLFFYFFTSIGILNASTQPIKQRINVCTGRVLDESTKEGLSFASIYFTDLEKGVHCDINGVFSFKTSSSNKIKVRISCLGYATKEISLLPHDFKDIKIYLPSQHISLEEFSVSSKYTKNKTNEILINQTSLEYIQPTSIRDVFLLLPGGRMSSNSLQNRSLIAFRQSGVDHSSSFGVGVVSDGVPLTDDGKRTQILGYTGNNGATSTNIGYDLRTISTDHIESINIVRGIASAKEGNLSSGLIKINSKAGRSPLRIRTKLDPLNKLVYIGKGFLLSPKIGTLHTGADIVKSKSDIRDILSSYQRFTTQLNYSNQFDFVDKKIDLNVKSSSVFSFNNSKKDNVTTYRDEEYYTKFMQFSLAIKAKSTLNYFLIDQIETILSSTISSDYLFHHKYVTNPTITIMQSSTVEGESIGKYLPSRYYTNYSIQNKPVNLFSSFSVYKNIEVLKSLKFNVISGASLSVTKNKGNGVDVDPSFPPFPSSDFIRPRANFLIPALINGASYLESKVNYKTKLLDIGLSTGIRATKMYNLPKNYYLNRTLLVEPRIHFSFGLMNTIDEDDFLKNTWHFGFGTENKLPSLDYLYPDKIYRDLIVLNAFFPKDPQRNLLITNTIIYNPENINIRANKNSKIELGWDIKYNEYILSLSLFKEQMNRGIEYFTEYIPISYTYYDKLKHNIDTKPSRDDFDSTLKKSFTSFRQPINSSKVVKKGFEYRLLIPKISALYSDIEINGAYYNTLYTSGVPVMYHPSVIIDNATFPYVGLYEGFEKRYSERFNTSIWINTHFPKLELIFTNFIQIVWLDSNRLGDDVDVFPSRYMDLEGTINVFTNDDKTNNRFMALKRQFNSVRYNVNRKPISIIMNMKVTKELGKHIRLSFFANNIFDINPRYQTSFYQTERGWSVPFFGTELIFNF